MYVLQKEPDKKIIGKWSGCKPRVTLKNEYGGVAHIINDDHCYVLLLNNISKHGFVAVKYWFKEVVDAVQSLPLPE